MNRKPLNYPHPYRGAHYELVRGGNRGVYWEGRDGLSVKLAVAESDRGVEIPPWWAIFGAMSSSNVFVR